MTAPETRPARDWRRVVAPATEEEISGLSQIISHISARSKDKLIARIRQLEAEVARLKPPKISPEDVARMDAILHPEGRCTCFGEGRCEWCVRTTEKTAEMTPDEKAFMDGGETRLFEIISALRAAAQERDRQIAVLEQERDDDTALIRRLNATAAAQAEKIERLKAACRDIIHAHDLAFAHGQPLVFANGMFFDHTHFNEAASSAHAALKPESKETK